MARKAAILILAFLIIAIVFFTSGCFHQSQGQGKNKKKVEILEKKLAEANKNISDLRKKMGESESSSGSEEAEATSSGTKTSKNFGYIRKVYTSGGKTYLTIDYAQMFTGQAAINAAKADGAIGPSDILDNDYYIRNKNPRLRTFVISSKVQIIAQTYNMTSTGKVGDQSISLATFKTIFQTKPSSNDNMVANPWWITLKGKTVIKLKEQYLP